jgi:hypothetical protein
VILGLLGTSRLWRDTRSPKIVPRGTLEPLEDLLKSTRSPKIVSRGALETVKVLKNASPAV